ncbi:hypothetical protein H4Q32_026472 [Labeo rohita]|uniref:DUF5641 domain-containing protein n=1 Tax=Labeo rohita TaxID=84645 RepID=A0ABQ8MY43_LABRO|nr:hypothetical protein H4Q32_026472 [Labeo rohita]
MANLPSERMETTPPFTYCGMDCFGPFDIKEGRRELKRYGLLFTCLCSRAVHIELLDDLSTDTFLNSLCAFIALRGNVRQLQSDQGTNFVGARPIWVEPGKGKSEQSEPLTPNLLLTMKSSIILPPPGDFVKEDIYLRRRWRRVQYLANEFWQRWKKEYLLSLQQRQKWHKTNRNAKVNDIVIIQDDTTLRNDWKLAKVTAVYPGQDGCVQKVQLLISDSTLDDHGKKLSKLVHLIRPIHKTVTLLEAD